MPYRAFYTDDGKGLVRVGAGVVTAADLLAVCKQQANDDKSSRLVKYALIDFAEVTVFKVSTDDVWQIAEVNRSLAEFIPSGTPVVIIAQEVLVYALSRMWLNLTEDFGWLSHIARTREEGVKWLQQQLVMQGGSQDALDEFPALGRYLTDIGETSQAALPNR